MDSSNDYYQFKEWISAEPEIEPATSCSQVKNATVLGKKHLKIAKLLIDSTLRIIKKKKKKLPGFSPFSTMFSKVSFSGSFEFGIVW